jgi:2-dehydropantoate 2-reductase
MKFVVFAAGAVGSTIGGILALKNNDVLLVCRKSHSQAIEEQNGLRMKSGTGDYFASLTAVDSLEKDSVGEDACILFTPKSNDTQQCVDQLSQVVPKDTPIVSFQNGVANEEIIAKTFDNTYGGVCKMTCSCLKPGQVSFRRVGRLVVGKYPKGSDAFTKKLADMLNEAGFSTTVSRSIQCDKWLKLAFNLHSTLYAIIEKRDHDSPEFSKLKLGLIEEVKKVFRAQKIRAKSCDSQELSLDEMIRELKRPKAPRGAPAVMVNNSTWQNLYLKRKCIENEVFHGPVIEHAREASIAAPYNEVVLEMVNKCHRQKMGPEALRAEDVLNAVDKRKKQK